MRRPISVRSGSPLARWTPPREQGGRWRKGQASHGAAAIAESMDAPAGPWPPDRRALPVQPTAPPGPPGSSDGQTRPRWSTNTCRPVSSRHHSGSNIDRVARQGHQTSLAAAPGRPAAAQACAELGRTGVQARQMAGDVDEKVGRPAVEPANRPGPPWRRCRQPDQSARFNEGLPGCRQGTQIPFASSVRDGTPRRRRARTGARSRA